MKIKELVSCGVPLVLGVGCVIAALVVSSKVISVALVLFALIAALVLIDNIFSPLIEASNKQVDEMYNAYIISKKYENGEPINLSGAELQCSTETVQKGLNALEKTNKSFWNFCN